MRVLQITNDYLGTRLYGNLFDALCKQGIENLIYIPVSKNCCLDAYSNKNSINVSCCFSFLDRLLFYPKQRKMYSDAISRFDMATIDIIHAHTLFSGGYLAYQLNKKYNIPYLIAVRNTDLNLFMKYMLHLRQVGVNIMLGGERIIFLSPSYCTRMIERYIPPNCRDAIYKKSEIIPNGIDDFWLDNRFCRAIKPTGKKLKLIFVGSVTPVKGVSVAIESCEVLIEKGYDITLYIIGKADSSRYKNKIEAYPFVKHIAYSPKEVVMEYMRQSDIFLMPSKTETFGLVYAEAMSQGLPIVYTQGEGFDGHFKNGVVGYSVVKNSTESVVNAIERILENYSYLSQNAVNNSGIFNWENIAQRYRNIYWNILEVR